MPSPQPHAGFPPRVQGYALGCPTCPETKCKFCVFVGVCIFLERDHAPLKSCQRTCDPERLGIVAVGVKNIVRTASKEQDSRQKAEARPAQVTGPHV